MNSFSHQTQSRILIGLGCIIAILPIGSIGYSAFFSPTSWVKMDTVDGPFMLAADNTMSPNRMEVVYSGEEFAIVHSLCFAKDVGVDYNIKMMHNGKVFQQHSTTSDLAQHFCNKNIVSVWHTDASWEPGDYVLERTARVYRPWSKEYDIDLATFKFKVVQKGK